MGVMIFHVSLARVSLSNWEVADGQEESGGCVEVSVSVVAWLPSCRGTISSQVKERRCEGRLPRRGRRCL